MRHALALCRSSILSGLLLFCAHGVIHPASAQVREMSTKGAVETYGKLPLAFEANEGQAAPQARFLSRGRGYTLFLTPGGGRRCWRCEAPMHALCPRTGQTPHHRLPGLKVDSLPSLL